MATIKKWESSKKYDNELLKIEHYEIHPEMLPFVGSHYDNARVLLVGESHYCSRNITEEDKEYVENHWYDKKAPDSFHDNLNFDTRFVLHNFLSLKRSRAHSMFRNPAKAIIEALELENVSDSEAFNICAFMNYFQKPAIEEGASINFTDEDEQIAYNVLTDVRNVLEPKVIIFLSDKALKSFSKIEEREKVFGEYLTDGVSHPTCPHWYKENGKGKFTKLIKERVDCSVVPSYNTYKLKAITDKMPSSFKYIERGNRFFNESITLRTYGKKDCVKEIVVHTKRNSRKTGVGYVAKHQFIWIWDYDEKKYIDEEEIDNYPGLREMYDEFIKYIKAL